MKDFISREKVCDYIAEFINNPYSTQDECEMVEAMIGGIQHMPSANPQESKWIPVSERMPEDNKEVLVYLNACPFLAWFKDGEWRTDDFVVDKDYEPIAWMPLPKPYKVESEEV